MFERNAGNEESQTIRRPIFLLLAAVTAAAIVYTVAARADERPAPAAQAARSGTDLEVLARMTLASLESLEASKVAGGAAQPDTRALALAVIGTHAELVGRLGGLATDRRLAPPTELDPGARRAVDGLAAAPGAELDRQYLAKVVEDHLALIALYTRAAQQARTSDLRSFAAEALPALRTRLAEARAAQAVRERTSSRDGEAEAELAAR